MTERQSYLKMKEKVWHCTKIHKWHISMWKKALQVNQENANCNTTHHNGYNLKYWQY